MVEDHQEVAEPEAKKLRTNEDAPKRPIRFRNYQPRDKTLVEGEAKTETETAEPTKKRAERGENNAPEKPPAVVKPSIIEEELQKLSAEDSINIAPKKVNWDLKNQVKDKLEKLQRRTQRAIVEILREKLAKETAEEEDDLD